MRAARIISLLKAAGVKARYQQTPDPSVEDDSIAIEPTAALKALRVVEGVDVEDGLVVGALEIQMPSLPGCGYGPCLNALILNDKGALESLVHIRCPSTPQALVKKIVALTQGGTPP